MLIISIELAAQAGYDENSLPWLRNKYDSNSNTDQLFLNS